MLVALSSLFAVAVAAAPLKTVPSLDLGRYAGTWFEIARLENRFERDSDEVTATYTIRADGGVDVVNRCRTADGGEKEIHGRARVPDPSTPGRLQVSFFGPFWGEYQVIALDDAYDWAVVGSPDHKFLWLLARTPTLAGAARAEGLAGAVAQGFDVGRLRETGQR